MHTGDTSVLTPGMDKFHSLYNANESLSCRHFYFFIPVEDKVDRYGGGHATRRVTAARH